MRRSSKENKEKMLELANDQSQASWHDDTIMPFGKYKGERVGDVPASYLLWWLDEEPESFPELQKYIRDRLQQLQQEEILAQGKYGRDN